MFAYRFEGTTTQNRSVSADRAQGGGWTHWEAVLALVVAGFLIGQPVPAYSKDGDAAPAAATADHKRTAKTKQSAQGVDNANASANPYPKKYYKGKSSPFPPTGKGGPVFYLVRSDEDISFLRDPAHKPDPMDKFKYIPLAERPDIYLSLNGQQRIRFESIDNNNNFGIATTRLPNGTLKFGPQDQLNLLRLRTQVGADLHVTDYFRAYAEFMAGQQDGDLPPGSMVSASQSNPGQLTQAFVEPRAKVDEAWVGLRAGRQMASFGNGLLLSPNPNSNITMPTFDGVRAYYDAGGFRVDGFAYREAIFDKALFSTIPSNVDLQGIYASYDLPVAGWLGSKAKATIEPFYFDYQSTKSLITGTGIYYDSAFLNGTAITPKPFSGFTTFDHDRRQTVGARLFGYANNFDFDGTAAYQFGHYGNYEARAFMAEADAGYTFSDVFSRPRIGVRGGVASGGASNEDKTISTFNPMASRLSYLTENSNLALSNLYNLSGRLVFTPLSSGPIVTVEAYDAFFWRYTQSDAVYSGLFQFATAPNAYAVTAATPGSYIGHQPAINAQVQIDPHIHLNFVLARFIMGDAMKAAGAKDSNYVRGQLTLLF